MGKDYFRHALAFAEIPKGLWRVLFFAVIGIVSYEIRPDGPNGVVLTAEADKLLAIVSENHCNGRKANRLQFCIPAPVRTSKPNTSEQPLCIAYCNGSLLISEVPNLHAAEAKS